LGAPVAGPTGAAAAGLTGMSTSSALNADNWTLDSQFGNKGAVKAISDAYDQTLPRIPDLPGKVRLAWHWHTRTHGLWCLIDLTSGFACC